MRTLNLLFHHFTRWDSLSFALHTAMTKSLPRIVLIGQLGQDSGSDFAVVLIDTSDAQKKTKRGEATLSVSLV